MTGNELCAYDNLRLSIIVNKRKWFCVEKNSQRRPMLDYFGWRIIDKYTWLSINPFTKKLFQIHFNCVIDLHWTACNRTVCRRRLPYE